MNANKYQAVSDELSYLLIGATDDVAYQAHYVSMGDPNTLSFDVDLRVLRELSNTQRIIQKIRLECAKQFSS